MPESIFSLFSGAGQGEGRNDRPAGGGGQTGARGRLLSGKMNPGKTGVRGRAVRPDNVFSLNLPENKLY